MHTRSTSVEKVEKKAETKQIKTDDPNELPSWG